MERAMILGAERPVVIFTKRDCCITHTIELLLRSFGAHPAVHLLDQLPDGEEIMEALVELGCSDVPAVFIGKKFIGGSNEIISLNARNELRPNLIRAKAIWI